MNTNDFDTLAKHTPVNCELRPDYMYYSRRVHSLVGSCLWILSALITFCVMVFGEGFEEFPFGLICFLFIGFVLFSFVFIFEREIGWLDEKGFHQEGRCFGLKLWGNNISRTAIREFRVAPVFFIPAKNDTDNQEGVYFYNLCTEIVTDRQSEWICKMVVPFSKLPSWIDEVYKKNKIQFSRYVSIEINIQKLLQEEYFCKKYEEIFHKQYEAPFLLVAWIAEAGNIVLHNLSLASQESVEKCQNVASDNLQHKIPKNTKSNDEKFIPVDTLKDDSTDKGISFNLNITESLKPLPTVENYTPSTIEYGEKPEYTNWNMKQKLDCSQFSRYNKFTSDRRSDWEIWFSSLLIACCICIPLFLTAFCDESIIFMAFCCIIVSLILSIFILPILLLIVFVFTCLTFVTWTFSTQKVTLKQTLFGIPFFFRSFDVIDITHFRLQQRFFEGSTDYMCDLIFLNKEDKEMFRIKKVARDDAKWILSTIKSYFR